DDVAEDNTLSNSINPVVPALGKMVIGEEATGTWCQWCPRGAVFMDQFETKYNQFWEGIAVHNGDPMTDVEYDSGIGAFIGGYPSAIVDRGTEVDPSGMSPDFFARLQIPPVATLINGATWDPISRILNVSVKADFALAANNSYKLACVLTEDDVTGTGSGYNQSNAYAGGGNGVMGGFELLPSSVPAAQMVYDHVARAIAPSFTGEANSFPATVLAGQSHTLNFSFTLPATWDENSINIIGLLLNPQGGIDNAGKATIAEAVANGYVAGLSTIYGENLEKMVTVYPNPASSKTTIHLNLESQASVVLSLLDVSGKVLSSKNYGSLNGSWNLDLNTSNYTA
ncbi:MAG: T9SS C-terminal target domain-containing protein, partial [Flavobacteriia bacterium]|nr:T9SS C-terminal target domain-containing protein [Flavobacteriia bacterium]